MVSSNDVQIFRVINMVIRIYHTYSKRVCVCFNQKISASFLIDLSQVTSRYDMYHDTIYYDTINIRIY